MIAMRDMIFRRSNSHFGDDALESLYTTLTGSLLMSVPFGPFVLTLDDITKQIRRTFAQFTDPRKGKNTSYPMVDAGLSAFSVFFMRARRFWNTSAAWTSGWAKTTPKRCLGSMTFPRTIRFATGSTPPSRGR